MMSYRVLQSAALSLGLAIAAAGCAYDMEEAPSLGSPEELEPQGIYANHLADDPLTHNALITNPDANAVMITVPLATESYADDGPYPELRYQLHHAPTREVMSYLVSCALDPAQSVSYTDSFTGTSYVWTGEIGLCPAWATGSADTTCQELVSACLLARVNAFGKKITLSMRGEIPGALPSAGSGSGLYPASVVPTGTYWESGDPISSFDECAIPTSGVSRNCGWKPDHVGTCEPGARVYIGAGAQPPAKCSDPNFPVLGSSSGNTVLRVCEGIRGCNTGSPNFMGQSGSACGTAKPALGFTCPQSGVYSVMSGPQSSDGPGVAAPATYQGSPTLYPAPEGEVFTWSEGAFFGNLWGSSALHPTIVSGMNEVGSDGQFSGAPVVNGSVFQRAFACTGPFWTDQDAYMNDRICAGEDTDCAAIPIGACDVANDNTPSCPVTHRCAETDGPMVSGDGDFQECASGPRVWENPISVYLNDPSDIVDDPDHAATRGSPDAPLPPLCP